MLFALYTNLKKIAAVYWKNQLSLSKPIQQDSYVFYFSAISIWKYPVLNNIHAGMKVENIAEKYT